MYAATPTLGCDFDSSLTCDIVDIDLLTTEIAFGNNNPDFDMTGDGSVDVDDRNQWLSEAATENLFAAPYQLGDTDLSGDVVINDLNTLALNWNGNSTLWSDGNFDGANGVNISDLNDLALNWNSSIPVAAAAAVPEPTTSILLVLLGGFALLSRRRK